MAAKLDYYTHLAEETAARVISGYRPWTEFLSTASRLYKYPYHEQLMIYAQRPDATACAEYNLWNDHMRRYVRRGARGIALIDISGDVPTLRYVFDVADTGERANSRRPFLWQMRDEQIPSVQTALEQTFSVPQRENFALQLEQIAARLVGDYWTEHQRDIRDNLADSIAEGYDEYTAGTAFRDAATVSVSYTLLSRCGLEPERYLKPEDFRTVFEFNSPSAAAALGTAVSQTSETVLRQIEAVMKRFERERRAERTNEYERTDLQTERRLSDSEPDLERNLDEALEQVRPDEEAIPAGAPTGAVEPPDPVGEAVLPSEGDRRDSTAAAGTADGRVNESQRRDRAPEGNRPDAVGESHEQPESAGRGDDSDRADLQLNPLGAPFDGEQLTLFPSEQEQILHIEQAESIAPIPFAFSFSQEDIDHVLRLGSNSENSRMVIASAFQKQKSTDEIAAVLKKVFHGGAGFKTDHGDFAAWYAEDGIHLAKGRSVRYERAAQVISWENAAERIGQLLDAGQYATNVEVIEAESHERTKLAEALWYHWGDLSDDARAQGYMSTLAEYRNGGFPDATANLSDALKDPALRQTLADELTVFSTAYEQDDSLMRFRLYNPHRVLNMLQNYNLPRREYMSDIAKVPTLGMFITEDEIDATLTHGSNIEGSKGRINAYFAEDHALKEQVAFLKNEYGTGGSSHAVSESGWIDYSGKGMKLQKPFCADVELNWNKVATRVERLVRTERFLTPEERAAYENQQSPPAENTQPVSETTSHAIDEALRAWNGDPASKRAVVRYMEEHGREKDTAQWLAQEYGTDAGKPLHITTTGTDLDVELSWTKVQRRIAQLIREDQFITQADYDLSAADSVVVEEEAPVEPPEYTTETVVEYPAEENNLPYDVVIQTLRTTEPQLSPPTIIPAENFRITDDNLGVGGPKAKYQANVAAIRLLKDLEATGSQANAEQQEVLSRYVGWGGLADAFDPDKENWSREYAELKILLTPEEYAAARGSTLNAHYTSPVVIKAIYDAVEKMSFQTGNILEPAMGIGNFFGCLPESMQNSKLYGVELDSITGRIAKQLYPKADITVAGFETTDRRDFYDLAIGNVPFGQYQVNDRAYNKLGFSIHDYFFAKALDQVRPGGVVAFVTSRYTMDKQSPEVRKYIAQRAELLGAIRLPNNAFKANAGTEVVSDIIFLQKRDRPIEIEPDWVHLGQNEDGFAINSYFVEHPEMMLGRQSSESTQYGKQDFTLEPIEGLLLEDQLEDAVKYIRGTYTEAEMPDLGEGEEIDTSIPADPNVKNYSYTVVDGDVYYRENSLMVKPDLNATALARVKGMVELRDCVQKLISQQMDGFVSDETIRQTQHELGELYDSFTAKHGLINSRGNALAFADDSSYYLLCSLEVLDEDNNLKRKADMFTKRTIKPHEVVTSVDTASEALALSISEKACVDLPYMSQLTGKDEEALVGELAGVIFHDPVKQEWQTADEYLSGNVREKLRIAQSYASPGFPKEGIADYRMNVAALSQAQPKDLDASEIEVRLGATWIEPDYIRAFMLETFEPPYYLRRSIEVNYSPFSAEWNITGKSQPSYSDVNAYMTYGTERANAYKILEETLNLRDIRIYDTVTDPGGGERRVLNSKETTLAQQKQQAIKDEFQDWIWRDPDRRRELVTRYNEIFNSNRPREYDGSHITFSGMNPEIHLREHQLNAVAHILYGGNTLLAHEVGAGKTFEMVAAAMESKRLGLCSKPMFVVPNHLIEQWAGEFLRLYPSANILATTKKDFEPHNRKKFCGRIATGDYDAIIIGHSQFERIPVSQERQERLLQEQIEEIKEGIEELKASRAERFTVKSLERTKKSLEVRLKKLQDTARKDDVVTFEQLGVDRLYVDEAHHYKNMFLYTKMRNVAGLSTTDAQKSSDMYLKCRYLDEITGGRGIVFATGTPVSNSMTELYTMMRYLQHDTLKEKGLSHFDCWASTFGETSTAIELAPEGTGYRARTRFAKFFNLPELMTLFKEAADIKTADQLNLPTPTPHYHNVVAQPTEVQQAMVQELSERAARVHSGSVDPSVDNMLRITSDGRKLGLDQRVINPNLPDDPMSKVNLCVDNIHRIWDEGQEEKMTQLVFCDLSTPQNVGSGTKQTEDRLDSPELHAVKTLTAKDESVPAFNVYDDIRNKLVAKGIPREQIAFIHEANTDVKKKELFGKVRSGQVRVLIGSTAKMGAGTNVQDRLIALHDLDCPWRPGDLEQRSGRIIRQGNMNPEVHIYRYATSGTFDSYLWQTVEQKQKFISQIMTSKSPVRSCKDVDETALSYAEIKALCAGDPRIKEKMDLDVEVAKLKLLKANHQSQQFRLEDNILRQLPEQIEQCKGFIAGFEADGKTLAAHSHPADGFAGMTVRGDVLTDKENAGAALLDALKEVKGLEPVSIGSYRGFSMSLTAEDFGRDFVLTLKGEMSHRVILGKDPRGNLTRIDNVLDGMPARQAQVQTKLDGLYAQLETAKAELGKPFAQEQELKAKAARLAELNIELNIDGKSSAAPVMENTSQIAKRPHKLQEER